MERVRREWDHKPVAVAGHALTKIINVAVAANVKSATANLANVVSARNASAIAKKSKL